MFLAIGLSGLLVNSLVAALGKEGLGAHYLVAAVLATQVTSLWSFILVEFLVFSDRRAYRGKGHRFVRFLAMNNTALALRGPIMYVLTSRLGLHYLLSNLISIVVFTIGRYSLSEAWIWARGERVAPGPSDGGCPDDGRERSHPVSGLRYPDGDSTMGAKRCRNSP